MTREEARALLVEQGARMIAARITVTEAREVAQAATREWRVLAAALEDEEFLEHGFSPAEQSECFTESVALLGGDPNDPRFDAERVQFQMMARRANAEMN